MVNLRNTAIGAQRDRFSPTTGIRQRRDTGWFNCMVFVAMVALGSAASAADDTCEVVASPAHTCAPPAHAIASSTRIADLVLPEGITSWEGRLYVGTFNIIKPADSRVLVFNQDGTLLNEIGGHSGEQLIGSGALLGLTVDKQTGDLFVAANSNSQIVRVHSPGGSSPLVSLYAQLPPGAGPEDLNFGPGGLLYSSDSNLGRVYSLPRGGGSFVVEIGPPASGARHSDNGLFASPLAGLSPNGIVFSQDQRHLFVANTYTDSLIIFDVGADGHISSDGRLFASFHNDDLEMFPSGFDPLVLSDTRLGFSASTPVNGPDGLALDADGNIWVASILGDNLTVVDSKDGHVIRTIGSSAGSSNGLLNMPAGMTFIDDNVYSTNLGLFADGTHGNKLLPFTIVRQRAGVTGFGGNGNE